MESEKVEDMCALSGSRPSDEAAKASSPSGFDPARIIALNGPRYSPNLRKFLRSRKARHYSLGVYRNAGDGWLYIGQLFDDGWFHGARLARVLTTGSKAETWAFSPTQLSLTLIADFWDRYAEIGRCVIDPEHNGWWLNEETRWLTDGDTRSCLWCGDHTQHLRRWTEKVRRERWEPAIATVHEGAVAKPIAQNEGSPRSTATKGEG